MKIWCTDHENTKREREVADDIHHEGYAAGQHNEDKKPQCHNTKLKNNRNKLTMWNWELDFKLHKKYKTIFENME
jgi:hypothetical protein